MAQQGNVLNCEGVIGNRARKCGTCKHAEWGNQGLADNAGVENYLTRSVFFMQKSNFAELLQTLDLTISAAHLESDAFYPLIPVSTV